MFHVMKSWNTDLREILYMFVIKAQHNIEYNQMYLKICSHQPWDTLS